MKLSWIALPYLCIIAYVVFLFISADECMKGMDDFYDMPYHVSREVREIRGRLNALRNTLPIAFASPQIKVSQIKKMLEEHNQQQDESIRIIKDRFHDDPEGLLKKLDEYKRELRSARIRVAVATDGNDNMEFALAHYNAEIAPPLEKINDVLNRISLAADTQGQQIRHDFEYRHLLLKIAAVILGFFVCFLLFLAARRDKAKQKALARRDRLFNLLGENVDDVFLVSGKKGAMEFASDNSRRVLGLPEAGTLEKTAANIYARLGPETGAWLKSRLADNSSSASVERDAEVDNGARKLKIRIYPVSEDDARNIAVISDQTEALAKQQALKDALESSRQANAAKSNFLAHMSHEIRTPMNAIIGMTSIALTKIGDMARIKDCLEKISQSSRHLLGLINDVLDMSRIEGGKLTINHEVFNLSACIENIASIIHQQTDGKEQNFEVIMSGVDVNTLIGDSLRVNQILLNLLSNASKFTPAGGRITFKIDQIEKNPASVRFRFVVQDNGIGMSPEFQSKVYDPFEQATPGVAAKFGGSGLGLAITKNLVSLLGGVITLKSAEGKGTEFQVELPFELPDSCPLESIEQLERRKVLIVDDDEEVREHASLLINQLGMETVSASGGAEAIGLLKEAHEQGKPFDICFMDWKMPGMGGEDAAREIRAHFGDETLVIIISGYDWNSIEQAATDAGASGFVPKPFFPAAIANAIKATGAGKTEEKGDTANFAGCRILLVEDNDFNREISNEFLEMAQIEVDNAENGQEALDKFLAAPEGHYDLVLMDLQMPVMDGYEATRKIRASDRPDAASIPILAMTANAFREDVAAVLEAGMSGHIAKPVNASLLYARLAEFLKRKS